MLAIDRIRITFNLLLAAYISIVDCLVPDMFPGTTSFLVKKVSTLIYNGVHSRTGVLQEVSASTRESCIMDEASYSDSERNDEQESQSSECIQQQSDGSVHN